jgi:hypothetical protein
MAVANFMALGAALAEGDEFQPVEFGEFRLTDRIGLQHLEHVELGSADLPAPDARSAMRVGLGLPAPVDGGFGLPWPNTARPRADGSSRLYSSPCAERWRARIRRGVSRTWPIFVCSLRAATRRAVVYSVAF